MSEGQIETLQSEASTPPGRSGMAAFGLGEEATPAIPEELSILPLRGLVIFPGTVLPLTVSRPASIKLLDETLPRTKVIGLLTQRDETKENPGPQDLYGVGTAALVLKLLRQPDDRVVMIVQGIRRFALRKIVATDPFLRAEVDLPESISPPPDNEWLAEFQNLRDSAARLLELSQDVPEQAAMAASFSSRVLRWSATKLRMAVRARSSLDSFVRWTTSTSSFSSSGDVYVPRRSNRATWGLKASLT
jgi:ATP-dependent Lon protease